jgi:hypothetical protein
MHRRHRKTTLTVRLDQTGWEEEEERHFYEREGAQSAEQTASMDCALHWKERRLLLALASRGEA